MTDLILYAAIIALLTVPLAETLYKTSGIVGLAAYTAGVALLALLTYRNL